jgi:hypothetical protein
MFRIALATYLTLAFLISPCLCCCFGSRVATAMEGGPDSCPAVVTSGCGCRESAGEFPGVSSARASVAGDTSPPCDKHPCPAKRHHEQSVMVGGTAASTIVCAVPQNDRYQSDAMLGGQADDQWPRFVACDALRGEPVTFPGHSGREILCMICVMRC